ncbi:MAG: hypothetical protein R3C59_00575 [Planctomycetaceae bacterium]
MASPFKFFRKYSGGMMIVMVILSMLLFTMTDLFSDPGRNLWLLGLLIGGAVFAVAGIGQGRWWQWGIGGAVLGTLLGVILPEFVQGGGVINTSLGVITRDDMDDMRIRRSLANEFVAQATEACFGQGTRQFATYFGFDHEMNEDVVLGRLLRAEADRLGIVVDSRMVGDYLKRITSDKLTAEDYVGIRNSLTYDRAALTEDTLQEILADEIKARMAYQMLRTRPSTLPPGAEVYWEYYRRLHVRQQIVTTALDVDSFLDQVGEPSDQQVAELFDTYRGKFPNEVEPGSPGFRLPLRATLAYLELDSVSVEDEIGEISDADVQTYYDNNKETSLIRTPVLPDPAKPESSDDTDKPDEDPADAPKPEDDSAEKKSDSNSDEKPADEKPADDKPEADSPEPAEANQPEATKDAPETDAAEEASQRTDDENCGLSEPDEKPADEKPADKKPADEKPADEKPPAEAPPADESSDSKAESALPSLTIPDVPAAGSVPQVPDAPAIASEIKYEYRELDDTLKQEIREEIRRQRVSEKVQEKLKAASSFMNALASQRTRKRFSLIEEDTALYSGENQKQQEALRELRESLKPYHEELNQKLKTYAKENGFAYVETPMISYQELVEGEDYSIATATEPTADPMNAARSATVPLTVFRSFTGEEQANDAQLYFVRSARRTDLAGDGSVSHFVYWATDFSLGHVPEQNEPGIREAVVRQWKRLQARELVKARSEELAGQVRDAIAKEGEDKQDMFAALDGITVTGKDDSAKLAVRKSNPFTWLKTSSASPMSFQQQPASLSPIEFDDQIGGTLSKVGDEFMKTVFEDMQDEQVAVVPNFDRSKYYVVHVTNRFPTPEVGEDALRDRFATEAQKFSFRDSPILPVMQQQLDGPAGVAWEKDLWRKYGVDPDSEPEE